MHSSFPVVPEVVEKEPEKEKKGKHDKKGEDGKKSSGRTGECIYDFSKIFISITFKPYCCLVNLCTTCVLSVEQADT